MLQPVAMTTLLSLLKPSLFSLGVVLTPLCSSFESVCTDSEPVSEGRRQPGQEVGHGMRGGRCERHTNINVSKQYASNLSL